MLGVTLEKAATDVPNAVPQVLRLSDLLATWETEAKAAHEARESGKVRGPITALDALDTELGGALALGLHIVHGTPGSGKTAFALQIAATCLCPSLYVTCEMAPIELFRRLTARVTNTPLGKLKSGELTPENSLALARRAVEAAPLVAIADATRAFAPAQWIQNMARAVQDDHKHLLVVVDSVHSWADGAPGDLPEYDALNEAVSSLRTMAHTLQCPVLAVAERNRASMRGGGMNASAGTRKFEYGAETVFDLQRENDEAPPKPNGEYEIKLVLAKNRNGAPGRPVRLLFHGAFQRFREEGGR